LFSQANPQSRHIVALLYRQKAFYSTTFYIIPCFHKTTENQNLPLCETAAPINFHKNFIAKAVYIMYNKHPLYNGIIEEVLQKNEEGF
jgi:hypothetical protein